MSSQLMGKIMKSLLFISALAILAGALFKLQHWANGEQILTFGLFANFVLSSYEIRRLRRSVLVLEKEKSEGV